MECHFKCIEYLRIVEQNSLVTAVTNVLLASLRFSTRRIVTRHFRHETHTADCIAPIVIRIGSCMCVVAEMSSHMRRVAAIVNNEHELSDDITRH